MKLNGGEREKRSKVKKRKKEGSFMEDTETGTEKCQVLSTSDHYECARERSRQLIHNLNTRSRVRS